MRTNIDIDEKLMKKVLKTTGLKTKKDAVHYALNTVVRLEAQVKLKDLRGRYEWVGDLDKMRTNKR